MDKNTLSEFGWIVVVVIMLAIIIPTVPILSRIMTDSADSYVEKYFGTSESANKKLPAPVLKIQSGNLVITDASSDATEYDIFINYALRDTISAARPNTEYALPSLGPGSHSIAVVAKAEGKTDSKASPITYNVPLQVPELTIDAKVLTITDSSLGAESFDIYINYLLADTVSSAGENTGYDLSGLSAGEYEIAVIGKASGVKNSEQATINYTATD